MLRVDADAIFCVYVSRVDANAIYIYVCRVNADAMSHDDHGGRGDGSGWAAPPSWDGDPTRFRTYQQEVWLWYDTISDAPKYSCGARLVRGLTGVARKTGRGLDRAQLRGTPGTPAVPASGDPDDEEGHTPAIPAVPPDPVPGIQYLFEALGELIGQRPVLRRGEAMKAFYERLRQSAGETTVSWLGRFRDACTVLEENEVGIDNAEVKGWWLLHKSEISQQEEQAILTATGLSYDYLAIQRTMLDLCSTPSSSSRRRERPADSLGRGPDHRRGPGGGGGWRGQPRGGRGGHVRRTEEDDALSDAGSETSVAITAGGGYCASSTLGSVPEDADVELNAEESLARDLEDIEGDLASVVDQAEKERLEQEAEHVHDCLITIKESKQRQAEHKKNRGFKPSSAGASTS